MSAQKKGFTLVELLVVISVIAILSVIGLTLYTSVLRGARDTKRKADLTAISRALEQYKAANGIYPAGPAWSDLADSWGTFASTISPYIAQPPTDHKNGGSGRAEDWYVYGYVALSSRASYRLCANLENNSDSARNVDYPTVPTANPPAKSCSEDANKWGDFQVVSQQ